MLEIAENALGDSEVSFIGADVVQWEPGDV